jgi:hypothetical protein
MIDRKGGGDVSGPLEQSIPRDRRVLPEFILAKMRCAVLRSRLFQTEIESIGVALRGGLIDSDCALSWLNDINALEIIFEGANHDAECAA